MSDIDLGFAEESDGKWLTNAHFPSKIGGKPAWLHLGELPSAETLKCYKCGNPKSFLCQIYAPFDDEYNFHRMIYVFVCRTESCYIANNNETITILRSQLPVKNEYYPDEPPSEAGEPVSEILPPNLKLCRACGCLGHLKCSRCKQVNYCGTVHQRLDWKYHKLNCSEDAKNNLENGEPIKEIVFPEWEICMNADDDSVIDTTEEVSLKSEVDEQEQMRELDKLISCGKAGDFQNLPESELEKYTKGSEEVDDKYFRSFRKECSKEPNQIIRYKRSGQPLWIADAEKTVKDIVANVPACDLCGTERQYEFQIMPQMLNYLKDPTVDWGVLAIYTCPNSCPLPEKKGYTPEYVVKQDICDGPFPVSDLIYCFRKDPREDISSSIMATSSSSSLSSSSSSAKVLLFTCLLMHISMELSSASAIPIWEYLMRDEKMLYLYSTFAQLVSVHCKATAATTNEPVNQCKRNLLSYGYGQLQTFSDNELDALDISQRGANELIWSSIMKHHPSSTLITTRKPIPTPPATSIIILTHQKPNKGGSGISSTPIYEGEASEISGLLGGNHENSYPKNPLFGDDESEEEQKHQYAMDMDIAYGYPGQERPSQVETFEVPIQKQQVHPSLSSKVQTETKTFLTGPLVFRLRPDGSPVEEDLNKPLPKDDDLEAFPIFSYNSAKTPKEQNSEATTQPQTSHYKHRKIATISALKQQHFASLGLNQELQPPSLPSDEPRAQRRFQVEAYPSAGTYHFYPRRQ